MQGRKSCGDEDNCLKSQNRPNHNKPLWQLTLQKRKRFEFVEFVEFELGKKNE